MEFSRLVNGRKRALLGCLRRYCRAYGHYSFVTYSQILRISQNSWGCLSCVPYMVARRCGFETLRKVDTSTFPGGNDRQYSSSSKFSKQDKKDYYSILRVSPKATASQIKTAFYRLSIIHHPDKNKGSADAQEKFSAIAEAYSVLGNTQLRKKYDTELRGYRANVPNTSTEFTAAREREFRERGLDHRFDAWTQQHYNDARMRKQRANTAKVEFKERQKNLREDVEDRRITTIVMIFLISLALTFGFIKK